jgi:hypothetical protein
LDRSAIHRVINLKIKLFVGIQDLEGRVDAGEIDRLVTVTLGRRPISPLVEALPSAPNLPRLMPGIVEQLMLQSPSVTLGPERS